MKSYKSDLVLVLVVACIFLGTVSLVTIASIFSPPKEFTEALEASADSVESLTQQDDVIKLILEANNLGVERTDEEVQKADIKWQTSLITQSIVINVLDSDLSHELNKMVRINDEFAEVFITDVYGVNIGMTNITSDYYQADEEWWIQTYNNGKGWLHFGEVEFDDSANKWVIPLYYPVIHEGEVIAVIKASIDTSNLR